MRPGRWVVVRFDTALPSAVARALILAGASLLVACGSAESDRTAAPTTSSSVAPPATQEERPRAAHLLALTGEGLNSLVVLDPESGDER